MTKIVMPGDILRANEAIAMIPEVDLGPSIEVPPIPPEANPKNISEEERQLADDGRVPCPRENNRSPRNETDGSTPRCGGYRSPGMRLCVQVLNAVGPGSCVRGNDAASLNLGNAGIRKTNSGQEDNRSNYRYQHLPNAKSRARQRIHPGQSRCSLRFYGTEHPPQFIRVLAG